jgi:hypothetical protein
MNAVHGKLEMKPAGVVMVILSSCHCDLHADNTRRFIKNRVTSPRITDCSVTDVTRVDCIHRFTDLFQRTLQYEISILNKLKTTFFT